MDTNLISCYAKLIFSNYKLNDKLFEAYENNNFNDLALQRSKFNQKVNNSQQELSCSTYFTFDYWFNKKVSTLSQNISHLFFGYYFNQNVNKLPKSITYLAFGNDFCQTFNLPQNVKHLKLDCNNQSLVDYLPNSLKELELSYWFNLELNNLPTSIHKIVFYKDSVYDKELNCLPNFVEFLQLPEKYNKKISNLPNNLKTIKCSKNYEYINDFVNFNVQHY